VRNLSIGSKGDDVKALQNALNAKLTPSPRLVPDGAFGGMTLTAVKKFQAANWLVEDGVAGPCTQNCALGLETYTPILHRIPFIAQPNDNTCWAASTAMMTNSNVAAVRAKTPDDMIGKDANGNDAGLKNSSGSDQAIVTGTRYGAIHGLKCFPPQSYMISALRSKIQTSPMMWDMLWNAGEYAAGNASPGHMIVVIGMRGDDEPNGKGTTLRIHDPWPPNKGKIYSVGYFKWMQEVPTRTYRVFTK
jgi:peptidoglycan hydrolase-like protein with peptidoglycan-binding domain